MADWNGQTDGRKGGTSTAHGGQGWKGDGQRLQKDGDGHAKADNRLQRPNKEMSSEEANA